MVPVSVNLMPAGPVAQVVELATLAEARGCRRCWVYDEGMHTRDVYVTLAAIAGATTRIGLGPGITNPYVRHPGATAAAVATLRPEIDEPVGCFDHIHVVFNHNHGIALFYEAVQYIE